MAKTITPAEFAVEVDSDNRTVRKFLRATQPADAHPGKGSRWALPATKRELTKLSKQFADWTAAQAKPVEDEAPEVESEEIEVEDEALLDD